MSLQVTASLATKVGFASHQNAVAILTDLALENAGEEPLLNLTVRLGSGPSFVETKLWKIDVLQPGASLRVSDRNVNLNAGYLADLSESLRGEIIIEVSREDETPPLFSGRYPVELLAKNHWGGTGSMPELLPAFCMPNDPAVDKVLKAASDVLRRAGKESGIDGYKSKSRMRTWELASAIWSAVSGLGLGYSYPPASFEVEGQKVRTPGAILEGRLATCLDTSMLFASAMEQAGLNPLIILSQGHAFVGVWLQPQEFSQLTTDEAAAVRKRVELQEMLVFETTLVTNSPVPSFSTAVEAGKKKLSDEEFRMAIDIRRARMRKIKPLSISTPGVNVDPGAPAPTAAESLEEAPRLPAFDVEITQEPTTADDRVSQWQRKLLDLTARNRLLHLPERSKHVPLICADPGALEDLLSAGKTIRIAALPDLEKGGRDAKLYEQQNREELQQQYAREALLSNEVLSPLPQKKLEAELIDLYRKARTDMDEGGANTLFLALGFLNWKKSADDTRTYRAPLILLPVKLQRRSALSGVTMIAHEDEPRFNLTLLELLRQDFDLRIPGLDGELLQDESGIDVIGVWNRARVAVKEIPGFEVTTETALGTFSFAKYLMWKDLTDRKDQLTANSVVKHLIERGEERFADQYKYPSESELDAVISPAELFTPLPADSSQIAAVVASARGCNFVLDGPPGTGKSQTIANMIVHNLSIGRRVLFVAEKMAALEVVHRRLAEKGLAEFCLEVHSNKTSKIQILEQLDRAWSTRGGLSQSEWDRETDRLRTLRDRLNGVCERLHLRHPNGMTIHEAVGRVTRDHGPSTPRLSWANGTQHSTEEFVAMRETARRVDLNFDAYSDAPTEFCIIEQVEWSNGWQESVLGTAKTLPMTIDSLVTARDQLKAACQFAIPAETDVAMERLTKFVRAIQAAYKKDLSFAFAPDLREKLGAARRLLELLGEYGEEEAKLSVRYGAEAVRKIDVDQLEAQWAEATKKFWFLASFAKKRVAKTLAAQAGTTSFPQVPHDSPLLRRMKELLRQMDALKPMLSGIPGCAGLDSHPDVINDVTSIAEALQQQLPRLVSSPDELISIKGAVRRLVVDANEFLGEEGTIAIAVGNLEGAIREYREAYGRFVDLCAITKRDDLSLNQIKAAAETITTSERRLRSWCTWRRVRQTAIQQNLAPLVIAVEEGRLAKGEVEPTFLTAYSKWFAAEMIDREPILRDFVSVEHMDCIKEFRRVDEQVAKLTADYARTALSGQLPARSEVGRNDGYGILKHELQKKRSHKPLRRLASEMGEAFCRLAPCMLMSPLSIAQYLPADQQLFDLVIFDEASQITPWDAVGSIARGKQVVIAGDPRQMPPTNFFQRGSGDTEFDGDVETDLESILDECLAVGIPRHSLSWHYRSRHESLIAFSNHAYYGNNLITFPAAVTRESAVIWRRVQGTYAKGKGQTNQAEAEAMVAETVRLLTDPGFIKSRQTLGLITLNSNQQKLVEDLLDAARRKHPEIEPYFKEDQSEPVVVKNLETVQGDERDVILLGICYGPTELGAGSMSMNFGPLNRDGGERRLNVALTRSKHEMVVFTSFDPSLIDLNRTSARAVRDLKHFLEFADKGPRALAEAVQGSVGGFDSPFEEAVAGRLRDKGWEVVPQVGVSRFRIDLGIVHPDRPGDFLVGVECDGATYHRSATARDRDKVRAAVLNGLGWDLLRVWSTDWFVDQEREVERLHTTLESLLNEKRARHVAEAPSVVDLGEENTEAEPDSIDPKASLFPEDDEDISESESGADASGQDSMSNGATMYRTVDFSEFLERINPVDFYDDSYNSTLVDLIRLTLQSEAPIADDLLIQRIARAHDFKRVGRLIRERVLALVDVHFHLRLDPVGGAFVWLNESGPREMIIFRVPVVEGVSRSIEEIPSEEILAVTLYSGLDSSAVEIARALGIKRLTTSGKERIERAIEFIRGHSTAPIVSSEGERFELQSFTEKGAQ
jgi:very-short-patch-repair endonuclease